MFKHTIYVLAACAMFIGCSKKQEPVAAVNTPDSAPVAAARAWLNVVDQGKYTDSWSGTSGYFQGIVSAAQLNQSLSAVRKPMGTIVSRVTISEDAMTSMPGAPDGRYVVTQFKTEFSNKKSAVETVTVSMDGEWKVAGYYIK